MPNVSTPAIMLRRIDFGDFDLIVSFLTAKKGKITIIAKSAKKSTKRFSGILELFSILEIVYRAIPGKGLPMLQEAVLKRSFPRIRVDIRKTAYASYWAELINESMEEDQKQIHLYRLFQHVLEELDLGNVPEETLSILFQIRFAAMSGLGPNLNQCGICRMEMKNIKKNEVLFDLGRGGIVCDSCSSGGSGKIFLSKGTIKQLQWIEGGDLTKAGRIRFTPQGLKEGLEFLEAFVPYHLGKKPRSLTFLQQIRG